MTKKPHVVVVGGGFAGLHVVRELKHAPADVTLVDRRNFHLFQPLLYQVATGALSPANIASPLRQILRGQENARVILGEVKSIDAKSIHLDELELPYDFLVVATGATHHYFGHDSWSEFAPGLKTLEDATQIRQRLLRAFEHAECSNDPQIIKRLLTFIVVGAGPTGVEMAGAFAEITRETLRDNFRNINPADAHVILVEGTDRVLPPYTPQLSIKAKEALMALGVDVRTQTFVENITAEGVTLRSGAALEHIMTSNIVWAAGVKASGMAKMLSDLTGAELDRSGRIYAHVDLSLNYKIFVAGDMVHYEQDGLPLPGVAPVAMQQGKFIGRYLTARLQGESLPVFRYRDLGTMATIGRQAAVADIRGVRFSGFLAWLAWLFVHLMQLVGFENRLLVLLQWGWNYVTRSRSARLITQPPK
jgi:NADH:ubiquinone reductase (H+-translocating)